MKKTIITQNGKDTVYSIDENEKKLIKTFTHSPKYIQRLTLKSANKIIENKQEQLKKSITPKEKIESQLKIPLNIASAGLFISCPLLIITPIAFITFSVSALTIFLTVKTQKKIKNNYQKQKNKLQTQINELEEIKQNNQRNMPNAFEIIKDEKIEKAKDHTKQECSITTIDDKQIEDLTQQYINAKKIYENYQTEIEDKYQESLQNVTIFLQNLGLNANQIIIICNLITKNCENNITFMTEEYTKCAKKKILKK